jgi:hypothetical protein
MAEDEQGGGGTVVGEVARRATEPQRVAPTTASEKATLRSRLRVVACWRLNDTMFAFGSSFVSPDLAAEMPALERVLRNHIESQVSLFGHADPTDDDDVNQVLSARRVRSIFALLTRNPDVWEELFKNPIKSDDWGNRSIQLMLSAVEHPPSGADFGALSEGGGQATDDAEIAAALGQTVPYYAGPITATRTADTTAAIKRFQGDHDLAVDGDPGPDTRKVLFTNYMEAICRSGSGNPLSVKPEQFIGQGKGPDGHGAFQACSEFNPVLVFSAEEARKFEKASDKTGRDAANAVNRRVTMFFFDPDTIIAESDWPCPSVKQGTGPCKKLFWPDGDKRRAPNDQRRTFKKSADTFGCRFYHSLAFRSPCEGTSFQQVVLRLFDDQLDPQPVYDAQYRVTLPTGKQVGSAPDGFVRLTLSSVPDTALVEWSFPDDPPLTQNGGVARFQLTANIATDSGDAQDDTTRRLHNLGFPESNGLSTNLSSFQAAYGLPVTGTLDAPTQTRIQEVHDSLEVDPQVTSAGVG